jgi:hypothetical protein
MVGGQRLFSEITYVNHRKSTDNLSVTSSHKAGIIHFTEKFHNWGGGGGGPNQRGHTVYRLLTALNNYQETAALSFLK